MDDQMRERMIVAFAQAVCVAGAPSFEIGMQQVKIFLGVVSNWAHFMNDFLQPIQTIKDLGKALNSRMSMSDAEEKLLLLALENLPQIMREGLRMASR